eukprot:765043-Hanusia_phi.AAC.1
MIPAPARRCESRSTAGCSSLWQPGHGGKSRSSAGRAFRYRIVPSTVIMPSDEFKFPGPGPGGGENKTRTETVRDWEVTSVLGYC